MVWRPHLQKASDKAHKFIANGSLRRHEIWWLKMQALLEEIPRPAWSWRDMLYLFCFCYTSWNIHCFLPPYLLPAVTNRCGLNRTKSQPEVWESGTEVQPGWLTQCLSKRVKQREGTWSSHCGQHHLETSNQLGNKQLLPLTNSSAISERDFCSSDRSLQLKVNV